MSLHKSHKMQVEKRDGRKEPVSFDKITKRITDLTTGLHDGLDPVKVAQKVIEHLKDDMKTSELDQYASEVCSGLTTSHPDYSILASRIAVSDLHKNTAEHATFSATMKLLYNHVRDGEHAPLVTKRIVELCEKYGDEIDARLVNSRDDDYTYFGFNTLKRSYLLRMHGNVVETPQVMLMRVSIGIWDDNLESAFETYDMLSTGKFTHASPTLFNAGTPSGQCCSCYLDSFTEKEDSIEGIYEMLKGFALVSQHSGGEGCSVSHVRPSGSYIHGNGGTSNGLIPMLKNFNATARYVNQGGKRNGAVAVYLEPWHGDIFEFLELRQEDIPEDKRCLDLFTAIWMNDLLMERVKSGGMWSLMNPRVSVGLVEAFGDEFKELYEKYEREGKYIRQVKAQDLYNAIIRATIETGLPYVMSKDQCNLKNNQANLGTIRNSNLCSETVMYSEGLEETAVCVLASISLPSFVRVTGTYGSPDFHAEYDYKGLEKVVRRVVRNLDRLIDVNKYPTERSRVSNERHRPLGIGVQGLANVFMSFMVPFESAEAADLDEKIFETIYWSACDESVQLAKQYGPYSTFQGSPASQGKLQFDLWKKPPLAGDTRHDWTALKAEIQKHGMRNSLLTALMPTASSSSILGNIPMYQPPKKLILVRSTLSGNTKVINVPQLVKMLDDRGLWCEDLKDEIIKNNGSIQGLDVIPADLQAVFKTAHEVPLKDQMYREAARGRYICQSQSANRHVDRADYRTIHQIYYRAYQLGLKTWSYYTYTCTAAKATQFTVKREKAEITHAVEEDDGSVCLLKGGSDCKVCSA